MIDKIKNSKIFYMILALLGALFLWFYVDLVEQPDISQTIYGIPVTFQGEETLAEQGLMIVHDGAETLDLTLSGSRTELAKVNRSNIVITVRAATQITQAGQQSLEYTYSLPSDASGVRVTEKSADKIEVNVVETASKTIEVRGVFGGSVADSYLAGEFSFTPDEVTISGEAELVTSVEYALVTLNETGLTATFTGDLPYELIDVNGQPVDKDGITCSEETIGVIFPVVIMKELDLSVSFTSGGGATDKNIFWKVSPESIMVSGDETVLGNLSGIDLGTVDLAQVVTTDNLTFDIRLPDNVTNVSGETKATVTVTVSGLATKSMEVTDIKLVNVPDGCDADLVTQSLNVLLRGEAEDLELVTDSFVYAEVDLSTIEVASGTRTVTANVYVNGFSTVGAVGRYTAVVTMKS